MMMSNTTDKMLDRYVYLHIEPSDLEHTPQGVTVHVKLDGEGVVVDAFSFKGGTEDECIATTWKTYNDMGVEIKEIDDE
tara:strand:+ start:177 stop:413 length:237 start_codon:yes stop_codon:yes gene_type:complete